MKTISLNDQELATALAALRFWQRLGPMHGRPEQIILTDCGRLMPPEQLAIEQLCERLNSQDDPQTATASQEREQATAQEIDAARQRYAACSDDTIEIDDNALVSRGDEGTWVQAWVWLELGPGDAS